MFKYVNKRKIWLKNKKYREILSLKENVVKYVNKQKIELLVVVIEKLDKDRTRIVESGRFEVGENNGDGDLTWIVMV